MSNIFANNEDIEWFENWTRKDPKRIRCYSCDEFTDFHRVETPRKSEQCTVCRRELFLTHGRDKYGVVVYQPTTNTININTTNKQRDRYCIACFERLTNNRTWGRGCYYCGKRHPSKLDYRLFISVDAEYCRVLVSTCSYDCWTNLLLEMRPMRTGWCSKCGLQHASVGPGKTTLTASYFEQWPIDTSKWLELRSWYTWAYKSVFGTGQEAYKEVVENLQPFV